MLDAKKIRKRATERFIAEVGSDANVVPESVALARTLAGSHDPIQVIAKLIEMANHSGPCEPRDVAIVSSSKVTNRCDKGGKRSPAGFTIMEPG